MNSKSKKTPYAQFCDGQRILAVITAVTAINLILAAFSVGLVFPCSAYLPRFLLLQASKSETLPAQAAFAGGILLILTYAVCFVLSTQSDRLRSMRFGFVLYAGDSLVYLLNILPEIASGGFRPSHIIELLFRFFLLYELYKADRVFLDPARKNPHVVVEDAPRRRREIEEEPTEPDDDEDEGIQW